MSFLSGENYFPLKTNDNYLGHLEFAQFFSPPECDAIVQLGLAASPVGEEGTISKERAVDTNIRKSVVRWLSRTKDSNWLWEKLQHVTTMANEKYFHFSLLGFTEKIQFTEYTENSHYTWHMDFGEGAMSVRKLSLSIELSDPETYDGGVLELFYATVPTCSTRGRGSAIVFPSYTMHRVTPVTKGTRYSLVLWVSGKEPYR